MITKRLFSLLLSVALFVGGYALLSWSAEGCTSKTEAEFYNIETEFTDGASVARYEAEKDLERYNAKYDLTAFCAFGVLIFAFVPLFYGIDPKAPIFTGEKSSEDVE